MKLHYLLLAAIGLFASIPVVRADNLRIDINGVYSMDSAFGESFGTVEGESPVVLSLIVDESKAFHLPEGAPLIDGQSVAIEMLVFPKEAVITASAVLGDIHWREADLEDVLPRSDLGFRPSVVLMGDLQSGPVKAYVIVRDENRGALQVSYMKCDSGCALVDDGWATDLRTGSRGKLSISNVTISRFEASAHN